MIITQQDELRKATIKMVLTIGLAFVLAIILHEPNLLFFIVKSASGAFISLGSSILGAVFTSSPPEPTSKGEKKLKRHHRPRRHSGHKKRKAKNQKR